MSSAERRKAGAGKSHKGFRVLALATAFVAGIATAFFVTHAVADYADGDQAKQSIALEDTVKIWRMAAWQQDDFFAQVALGDKYSQDESLKDTIEAYVWYYVSQFSAQFS